MSYEDIRRQLLAGVGDKEDNDKDERMRYAAQKQQQNNIKNVVKSVAGAVAPTVKNALFNRYDPTALLNGQRAPANEAEERYVAMMTGASGAVNGAMHAMNPLSAYDFRRMEQESAKKELGSAWWDMLGQASMASQAAQNGQMLTPEQVRAQMDAGARLNTAMQRNDQANQIVDWEGRDELLREYRRLDKIDNPQARQQAQAVREQLRQGDEAAGNIAKGGDMSYTVGETAIHTGKAFGEDLAYAFYNAALTAVDSDAATPSAFGDMIGRATGAGTISEYKRNNQEYRDFMDARFAEADALRDKARQELQMATENHHPVYKAGVDIGKNLMEMGTDVFLAKLTGGSSLVPMAIRVFGQSAGEARERGYDINQQAAYGAASAAIEVFTEMIGGFGGRAQGQGWSDELADKLVNELAQSEAGRRMLHYLIGAIEEGGEEVLSDLLQPAAEFVAGMDITGYDISDMLYDFFIGAAVGGTSSVTGMATTGWQAMSRYQGNAQGLIDMAQAAGEGTRARELAGQLQQRLTNKGSISQLQAEDLSQQAQRDIQNEDRPRIEAAVREQLQQRSEKPMSQRELDKAVRNIVDEAFEGDGNTYLKSDLEREVYKDLQAQFRGGGTERWLNTADLAASRVNDAEMARLRNVETKDGQQVRITGAEMVDGELQLRYEQDGKTVTAKQSELNLNDGQKDTLRQLVEILGEDAAAAYNGMGDGIRYGKPSDLLDYATSFAVVRDLFGAKGASLEKALSSNLRNRLSDTQVMQAMKVGQMQAQKSGSAQEGKVRVGSGQVSMDGGTITTEGGRKITLKAVKNQAEVQKHWQYKAVQAIAKALGIDVVLYESEAANKEGDLREANGAYQNGVIYLDWNAGMNNINDTSKRMLLRTMSHELTHDLQRTSPAAYEKLKQRTLEYLSEKMGENYVQLVKGKMANQKGLSYEGALDEVVADACETMLADSNYVRELVQKDRSLMERVWDWIQDWFERITDIEAEDEGAKALRENIAEFTALWDDALKQSVEARKGGQSQERAAEGVGPYTETAARAEARSGAEESAMSAQLSARDGVENLSPEEYANSTSKEAANEKVQFSFAGGRAKTANSVKLKMARDYESEGMSRSDIFLKTGWFRGLDRKWRFEIDNSEMKLADTYNPNVKAYELGQLIEHPKLFDAYPELKRVHVLVERLGQNVGGTYYPGQRLIRLNDTVFSDKGLTVSILAHEIQHAIQNIEGFTPGASAEYWENADWGDREWLNRLIRNKEKDLQKAAKELDEALKGTDYDSFQKQQDERIWNEEITEDEAEKEYKRFVEKNVPAGGYLYSLIKQAQRDIEQARKQLDSIKSPADKYRNTAGEIEARDVQERLFYNDAERRLRMPNVPTEGVYFARNESKAFSTEDASKKAAKTLQAGPVAAVSEANASGPAQMSLRPVDPVQPSSNAWSRTHDTAEAMEAYPNLWNVAAEESEKRNPTQIASTQGTYRNIYKILQREGFTGKILDASSGLGLGTKVGREEFGFDVDDIEPYPDASYKPKYTDYSKLHKKYDAIISSAVLNVLPQDQRDALVVKMGELLNPGGRMFITTRGKDVETLGNTGKNIHLGNMEWIETVKGSYQKGFTQAELKAYLEDALGSDFTVELSNAKNGGKFNNNTSIVVTKKAAVVDGSKAQLSVKDAEYVDAVKRGDMDTAQRMVDEAAKAAGYTTLVYRGGGEAHNVFDTNRGAGTTQYGAGTYFTDAYGLAQDWAKERAHTEDDDGFVGKYYINTADMFIDKSVDTSTPQWNNVKAILRSLGVSDKKIRYAENWGFAGIANALQSVGQIDDGRYAAFDWKNAQKVNDILRQAGYKGIIGDFYDSKQYIVFDSSLAKSADPVTYDDKGEVIPLSERFDSSKSDIRFSVRSNGNLTSKEAIDAEIDRLQSEIANSFFEEDEMRNNPEYRAAYNQVYRAESYKEKVEGRRALNAVKKKLGFEVFAERRTAAADEIKRLKDLRKKFLSVTEISESDYGKLKRHFGTTEDWDVAGFILKDGSALDFSGKKQYGRNYAGGREILHNEVGDVIGMPKDTSPRINMLNNGNIRLAPEIGGINLAAMPTAKQLAALRDYIDHNNGAVKVDIDDIGGDTVESFTYYNGTSSSKVISDIRSYFSTGSAPAPAPASGLRAFLSVRSNAKTDRELLNDLYERIQAKERAVAARNEKGLKAGYQKMLHDKQDVIDEQWAALEKYHKLTERYRNAEEAVNRELNTLDELINRNGSRAQIAQQRTILSAAEQRLSTAARALSQGQNSDEIQSILRRERQLQRERTSQQIRESVNSREMKRRVTQRAAELYEMLRTNSDKVHVPEVLKEPLGEFLQTLDFTSRRALRGGEETKADQRFGARLQQIRDILENQQRYLSGDETAMQDLGGYLDISEESMEFLRGCTELITYAMSQNRGFTINEMNAEQLRDLANFLSNLRTAIRRMNTFLANERFASVREAASADITELQRVGRAKNIAENRILNEYLWKNGTPYYIFKRFGAGGESIFQGFAKGWSQMAFDAREIMEFTKKAYTDKEVKQWRKEKHDFTLEDGSKITMTIAQIMELSQLLGRQQAVQHLQHGGMRIGNIETKTGAKGDTRHHHLSQADLEQILGALSDRQAKVARELQHFMAERGADWGNEVSMKRFGYRFYTEGDGYYPIKTDSNDRPMADTDAQKNSMFRLLNLSSSKSLNPKATNALVVGDIFDTFTDHMADMAKLHGMGLPILDAIKWFNFKERIDRDDGGYDTRTLQGALEEAFGSAAGSYFRTLMKDINGQTENGDRGTGLASLAIGAYKAQAVAANLRVALLQPTSYLRAATVLKPRYMVAAFGNFRASVFAVRAAEAAWKEAMQHSGEMVWKDIGGYDTDLSRSMRSQIQHSEGVHDKIVTGSMVLAEWGDKLTWGRLWAACKLQARAENPGVSGQTLMDATEKLFRQVIYSSQVMDSTLTRSELMRGKTNTSKLLTAFMAEPTLSVNILMDTASQYDLDKRRSGRAEAWKKNKGRIFKAFSLWICTQTAAALVESLADAMRDDDDEEYWKKLLEALFGEDNAKRMLGEELGQNTKGWLASAYSGNLMQDYLLLNKLPVLKEVTSLLSGFKSRNMLTEGAENLLNVYKIWRETKQLEDGILDRPTSVTYYGKMTPWGKIYKTLQAISQLSGTPLYNASRDGIAIWNTIMNGWKDDWKIKTYDPDALSQSKLNKYNEFVATTGVTKNDFQRITKEIDTNGNGSVSQAEAGPYLQAEEEAGRISREQADAIWSATTTGKATYEEWLAKLNEVSTGNASAKQSTGVDYDNIDDLYKVGTLSADDARKALMGYGIDKDTADMKVAYWNYQKQNPGTSMTTENSFEAYWKKYRPVGMTPRVYDDFRVRWDAVQGTDKNNDGKADSGSKKAERLLIIDSLPLTDEQKDELFLMNWSSAGLKDAPWHK